MLSDNIRLSNGIPVLSYPLNKGGQESDPFAFARRLLTALWVFDIDNTKILYANEAACELWQAENEEALRGRDLASDMSPGVAQRLKQYQLDFIERDASFTEMWTLYPKGQPVSQMVVFRGLHLTNGNMAMLCEVVGDTIDEPDNLRSAEALLHTDVMISLYEEGGAALYRNPAARKATARSLQGISDKFVDPHDYIELSKGLKGSGQHRMVTKVQTSEGLRWHDLSIKQCSDAVTGHPVILETAIDVSELKNARDTARYLAERDQLTGCYNRAFLTQYANLPGKAPPEQNVLISFDVDCFKLINDRFGHEMGDVVLREIVRRTSEIIRKDDLIIRLGGDEFIVILDNIKSDVELADRVENLHRKISEPISHEATKVNVNVSIGVTKFSPATSDLTAVIREADIALYASKQGGRNRVTFFDEKMGAAVTERNLIESDIKQSIENRDFELHFQPRIDLRNGKVVSAEGLVRWNHPRRGFVMPGDFIPICEETGMIEDLGQVVLELGNKQSVEWNKIGLGIDLSLNISPRQFQDKRLLSTLRMISEAPNFRHGSIELEITESVLIGDLDEIEEKLEIISSMGFLIAIDDFGTGFSNLSYISKFPLNCLKIDQSFISQLPKSGPIISLILTLAKQIGATVVAEGVETKEQFDWLRENDCDQAQGYYLSRPVPIESFEDVVRKINTDRIDKL